MIIPSRGCVKQIYAFIAVEGDLSALNNLEAEPKVGSVIPMLDQELQECTEPSSLSRVTRNAAGTSGKHPVCHQSDS